MHSVQRKLALAAALVVSLAPAAHAQPAMDVGAVIRNAGEPYTLGRESQSKLAFVDGSWWGLLGGTTGIDFYRFDSSSQTWSQPTFPGSHVTNDPNAVADVKWDGTNLIVLYTVGSGTGSLYVTAYSYAAGSFQPLSGFPVHIADKVVVKEYTVVEDTNGRLWVNWATTAQYGVSGSTGTGPAGWMAFTTPTFMGSAVVGADADLGSSGIVAFGSGATAKVGVMYTECRDPATANHMKFQWRSDSDPDLGSSAWSPVEFCQDDPNLVLTDDHVSIRSFEGQVWAASKTEYDTGDSGEPRFTLMRRDLDGNWSHWTSKTIINTDYSTRPICVIDTVNRLVYTFWHNLGVQYNTTPLDNPGVFSAIKQSILPHGGGCWNVSSVSIPADGSGGIMVLADDNDDGWQYWQHFQLGSSTQTLTSIQVTPNPVTIVAGGQVQFTAQGKDQSGNPMSVTPAWTTNGGTITNAGLFTAGATTGSFTATATSGSVSGTANVTITTQNQTLTSITITPSPASTQTGGTVQLTAQGHDQNGNAMDVAPVWSASGGTITQAGLYTAGSSPGGFEATATSGGIAGVDSINVSQAPPPVLTSIVVTPNPASTVPNGTVQFSAQGQDQNGNPMALNPSPTWTAAGGTISQSGLYTAGATAGSFGVSASSQGVTGNATVTISSAVTTIVVDDSDQGFSVVSGSWQLHYNPFRFGATDRLLNTPGAGVAQWKPSNLPAGSYDVYAWWPSRTAPATATYTVTTTSGPVSVSVDQSPQSSWGTWNKLGTYSLDSSSALVQISGASGQAIAADAVRFKTAGSGP